MRIQVETWMERAESDAVKHAGEALKATLDDIEANLIQVKAKSAKDRLKFPVKLNAKLNGLMGAVASAEGRPNEQSYAVYEDLAGWADAQLDRLESVKSEELVVFNTLIAELNLVAVG
jgi:hypothetical protein